MSDMAGKVGEFIVSANSLILELEEGQSLTRGDVSLLRTAGNVFACSVYDGGLWGFYQEYSVEQIERWPDAPNSEADNDYYASQWSNPY